MLHTAQRSLLSPPGPRTAHAPPPGRSRDFSPLFPSPPDAGVQPGKKRSSQSSTSTSAGVTADVQPGDGGGRESSDRAASAGARSSAGKASLGLDDSAASAADLGVAEGDDDDPAASSSSRGSGVSTPAYGVTWAPAGSAVKGPAGEGEDSDEEEAREAIDWDNLEGYRVGGVGPFSWGLGFRLYSRGRASPRVHGEGEGGEGRPRLWSSIE